MIEVSQLTKRYGDVLAVDNLSFTVRPGVVTGFLGPNGAGKTTTMRMILGLDTPTGGTTTVNGRPFRESPIPMRELGALLDASAVHGSRRAYHHLLCLAQSNRIPRTRVEEVLDLVGLRSVARRRAGKFSLGMGQRLGIAAALLGDPDVVMFDEPVNGLDPDGILWVRNLMRDLAAEGRTVLASSHLMSEMAVTADELIVIGQGRLIASTTVEAFVQQNSHESVLVRTPDAERLTRHLAGTGATVSSPEAGVLEVTGIESERIGRLAATERVVLSELTPRKATLEEAFMQLTRESVEFHATEGAER